MPKSFLPSSVLQTPALLPSWELCTLDSLSWTQIYHGNISLLLKKRKTPLLYQYSTLNTRDLPFQPVFLRAASLHCHQPPPCCSIPWLFSLAFDTVNLFPSLKDTPLSGCVIMHSPGYSFFGYQYLSDIEILDFLEEGRITSGAGL